RAAKEIARVAQQQESGFEQVLKAMTEIAHATEETVASTEAVGQEARSLNDLAASLQAAVKG
ncbi:MAG TPA: methyl-accepting chemotaxis protein, partial [Anaeromyxobacter sp.]|nr:methyl-accepting chemotaxis protein [Anaeromyxobacter sp.]